MNIHDQNSYPLNSLKRYLDQVYSIENGFQENIDLRKKKVVIHAAEWIGFNSTIVKGVTIVYGINRQNLEQMGMCM